MIVRISLVRISARPRFMSGTRKSWPLTSVMKDASNAGLVDTDVPETISIGLTPGVASGLCTNSDNKCQKPLKVLTLKGYFFHAQFKYLNFCAFSLVWLDIFFFGDCSLKTTQLNIQACLDENPSTELEVKSSTD